MSSGSSMTRADSHPFNVPTLAGEPCEVALMEQVGQHLQKLAARELSDAELEQHIQDTCWLWQRAYARFQAHGNPADRDEAELWLHAQNEAILMRSPAVLAARHAAFERRISEGVDFFQSEQALSMGQPGWGTVR